MALLALSLRRTNARTTLCPLRAHIYVTTFFVVDSVGRAGGREELVHQRAVDFRLGVCEGGTSHEDVWRRGTTPQAGDLGDLTSSGCVTAEHRCRLVV